MKILLLADCNSVHTIKWATSLSRCGVEIIVFSLGKLNIDNYKGTAVKVIDYGNKTSRVNLLDKLLYLSVLPFLKKLVKTEAPDIIHSHYATSYGLLGALINFHPFILSVWGSDVFNFPKKSFIHKAIIKYNFSKADRILSTSKAMALKTAEYTQKSIEVTPFGINTQVFSPRSATNRLFDEEDIVVGTIKGFEPVYGIDYLIRAFSIVVNRHKNLPLRLLLVGGGSQKKELRKLIYAQGIQDKVILKDKIAYSEVSEYHNMIDVFVALSLEESFGVAVIEASACGKPVVVSNVGGLPEVVEDNVTGFIVDSKDELAASNAIEKLVVDKELRDKMGECGRKRVEERFNWSKNVEQMLEIYKNIR